MITKLNKRSLILALMFFLVLFFQQIYAEKNKENKFKNSHLFAMTRILQKQGIINFLKTAKIKNLQCPKIYSAWHVKNLKGKGKNLLKEQEKRHLGLLFAKKMTELSHKMRNNKKHEFLESVAKNMLEAVNWLGKNQGYGNIFLQDRAIEIASVAMAKLGCDLNYPIEKVEALQAKIDWSWNNPENRRQILYEESDNNLFKKNSKYTLPGDYFSQDTWDYRWYGDKTQKVIQAKFDTEWRELYSLTYNKDNFKKQPYLEMLTKNHNKGVNWALPESLWDYMGHFKIKNGFGSQIVPNNLNSLLKYRKIMGFFPTKVSKETMERFGFHSNIAGAFFEAAENKKSKIQKERGSFNVKDDASPYDSGAALIYERYHTNTLYPDGELEWERYKKEQAEKEKQQAQNNKK